MKFYIKKNARGVPVAVINGYTFYKNDNPGSKVPDRLHCTIKQYKAAFTTTKTHEISRANLDHNHSLPKSDVRNGAYVTI